MRILFAGTPEAALPTLRELLASDHEIVAVVTRPDAPTGRGRSLVASPVGQFAEANSLPVIKSSRLSEPTVTESLLDLKPDLAVIVAFGSLIRDPLLQAWPWVNLHFSLLPAYRGAAPVQHALLNGEEITGVTTFILDAGLDTGLILGQATERVRPDDTTGALMERLSESGADLMMMTLERWAELKPLAQSNDHASVAPKISGADARINWDSNSVLIDRHIRAMAPKPGAWTTLRGQRIEIIEAKVLTERLPARTVLAEKHRVLVGTGSGAMELILVRPQGKKTMTASEWMRGLHSQEAIFE